MTSAWPPFEVMDTCRSCGSGALEDIIALGDSPIADRLVRPDHSEPEFTAPLTLAHCPVCSMCQIRETVQPDVLFPADYPYYSSVSPALVAHFTQSALHLIEAGLAKPGMQVIEAASNDGYLLDVFRQKGFDVLGVDPADGPVSVAREKGIETVCDFFGLAVAKGLTAAGRKADIFLANNVLAHVADTNDFVAGIAEILSQDGLAVIECPYLCDLVRNCAFDTIYHQHLLYLSISSLVPLFERHGMFLNDAIRLKVHGGSLRLFVSRTNAPTDRLQQLQKDEAALGLGERRYYDSFVARILQLKEELTETIARLKEEGKTIAGYGAAAKGTTLMHVFGIGGDDLEFIIDKSEWKQGLAMPVNGIPIRAPSHLNTVCPDYLLILAWNFANEIIGENSAFADKGGSFIVPIPGMRIVRSEPVGVSL